MKRENKRAMLAIGLAVVCLSPFIALLTLQAWITFSPPIRTYTRHAFHPEVPVHTNCVYNGEEYFYFDADGVEGCGIYCMDEAGESRLVAATSFPTLLAANSRYLYYKTTEDHLAQVSLSDGSCKEALYDCFEITCDEKSVFITIQNKEARDGTISSSEYEYLLKLDAADITKPPVNLNETFGGGDLPETFEEYRLRRISDGEYDYLYVQSLLTTCFAGVYDHNTYRQIYRNTSYFSSVYDDRQTMVLLNSYNYGSENYFMRFGGETFLKEFCRFPENYQYAVDCILARPDGLYVLLEEVPPGRVFNTSQSYHRKDILARVDVQTGEATYVYETADREERIVGFYENWVYLCRGQELERLNLTTGEREPYARLEEAQKYTFELCGKRLFAWAEIDDKLRLIGAYEL